MNRLLIFVLALLAACSGDAPALTWSDDCVPGALQLTLPPSIPAIADTPVRIFFRDAVLVAEDDALSFALDVDFGARSGDSWLATPSSGDFGDHPLRLRAQSATGAAGCGDTVVQVRPPAPCDELHLLLVGDSLTEQTYLPNDLSRMLTAAGMPWTMLGTVTPTNCDPTACQDALPGVHHQGYGGWSWTMYATHFVAHPDGTRLNRSSPFLFDEGGTVTLDVGRYVAETLAGVQPKVATFMLGSNDCFAVPPDDPAAIDKCIDGMLVSAQRIVTAFLAAVPGLRVGIGLTPPGNVLQAAWIANYAGRYSTWGFKRIQHRVVQREIEAFGNRETDGIFLVPNELALDPSAGFPPTNAIHPNELGYQELADAMFAAIRQYPSP